MTDNAELVRRLLIEAKYEASRFRERSAQLFREAAAALEASAQPVADRGHKWAPIMDGTICCQYCMVESSASINPICEKAPVSSELEAMRKERDAQKTGWEGAYALARKLEYELHEATDRAEAAESALAEANRKLGVARAAALEEAAKIAESNDAWPQEGNDIAQDIRRAALSQITNAEGGPERSRPGEAG